MVGRAAASRRGTRAAAPRCVSPVLARHDAGEFVEGLDGAPHALGPVVLCHCVIWALASVPSAGRRPPTDLTYAASTHRRRPPTLQQRTVDEIVEIDKKDRRP